MAKIESTVHMALAALTFCLLRVERAMALLAVSGLQCCLSMAVAVVDYQQRVNVISPSDRAGVAREALLGVGHETDRQPIPGFLEPLFGMDWVMMADAARPHVELGGSQRLEALATVTVWLAGPVHVPPPAAATTNVLAVLPGTNVARR